MSGERRVFESTALPPPAGRSLQRCECDLAVSAGPAADGSHGRLGAEQLRRHGGPRGDALRPVAATSHPVGALPPPTLCLSVRVVAPLLIQRSVQHRWLSGMRRRSCRAESCRARGASHTTSRGCCLNESCPTGRSAPTRRGPPARAGWRWWQGSHHPQARPPCSPSRGSALLIPAASPMRLGGSGRSRPRSFPAPRRRRLSGRAEGSPHWGLLTYCRVASEHATIRPASFLGVVAADD